MGCFYLLQDSNLIITLLSSILVDKIGSSTIHINLTIEVWNRYIKLNAKSNF